jgi:peptide chain release factor 3
MSLQPIGASTHTALPVSVQRMFANERTTVEEGFAGDVIGLTNPGAFGEELVTGVQTQG